MKAAVIGSGAWGTTLAKILAENGHAVSIWCHDCEIAEQINSKHENSSLLPGIKLPDTVKGLSDLQSIITAAELVVCVTASEYFRSVIEKIKTGLAPQALILSATKGLDKQNDQRMSEILEELLTDHLNNIAVLSGPNISMEIARQKPAVTVISAKNDDTAQAIQKAFNNDYFRVYTNDDVTGTEFGGTLKNVIAIAAGIIDGLNIGDNAKSALLVRGILEMSRLAMVFGAKQKTLFGLTGMGDLITTCSSTLSRNHSVGVQLADGKKLPEILKGMKAVAEGVNTTKAAYELAMKHNVSMPITEQMYRILFEHKDINTAIKDLMNRDLKAEL